MINIFKDNRELNDIVNLFYIRANEENLEGIDDYLKNIGENIASDFKLIYSACRRKNKQVSLELFGLYLKNIGYKYLGMSNESFYKALNNNFSMKLLQKEQQCYYENFFSKAEDIRTILTYTLKEYYNIVKNYSQLEDLREIYAIYQAIGYYIINILPKEYQTEFYEDEIFDELLSIDYKLTTTNSGYIEKIDYIIRDYIKEKYQIDLFEYASSYQRKITKKKD